MKNEQPIENGTACYSKDEVVRLIGKPERTVDRAVKEGFIPAQQIGVKSWIYPKAAIDLWLACPGITLANLRRQLEASDSGKMAPDMRRSLEADVQSIEQFVDSMKRLLADAKDEVRLEIR